MPVSVVPTCVTPAMMTSEIMPAIKAYSIAVAPLAFVCNPIRADRATSR